MIDPYNGFKHPKEVMVRLEANFDQVLKLLTPEQAQVVSHLHDEIVRFKESNAWHEAYLGKRLHEDLLAKRYEKPTAN